LQKGCIVVSIALLLNACKEPDGLGLDVLPDGQQYPIAWVDTFTVEAITVYEDSVKTSGIGPPTFLIGDFGDPIFGRVQSQLFTQIRLLGENVSFGANPILDSVVLNLAYSGSYGYTDKLRGTMKLGVYEVNNDIKDTVAHYSNNEQQTEATPIGQIEFRPDLFSEIFLEGAADPLPPSLRIPLDSAFGSRIMKSMNLANNGTFLTEFKGINIRSESLDMMSGFGSILYFNLASGASKLEIHYHIHVANPANPDSIVYLQTNLGIFQQFATHTVFTHEFSQEIVDAVSGTTVAGADKLYASPMSGVKMKLKFPFLQELNKLGIVAINKAEIVIPIDEDIDLEHEVPISLVYRQILDATGTNGFTADYNPNSLAYYGGVYNSTKKEYVFNAAQYIQSVLNSPEDENRGLFVQQPGTSIYGRRAVFSGPQRLTRPMQLRLTYTIIKE